MHTALALAHTRTDRVNHHHCKGSSVRGVNWFRTHERNTFANFIASSAERAQPRHKLDKNTLLLFFGGNLKRSFLSSIFRLNANFCRCALRSECQWKMQTFPTTPQSNVRYRLAAWLRGSTSVVNKPVSIDRRANWTDKAKRNSMYCRSARSIAAAAAAAATVKEAVRNRQYTSMYHYYDEQWAHVQRRRAACGRRLLSCWCWTHLWIE